VVAAPFLPFSEALLLLVGHLMQKRAENFHQRTVHVESVDVDIPFEPEIVSVYDIMAEGIHSGFSEADRWWLERVVKEPLVEPIEPCIKLVGEHGKLPIFGLDLMVADCSIHNFIHLRPLTLFSFKLEIVLFMHSGIPILINTKTVCLINSRYQIRG